MLRAALLAAAAAQAAAISLPSFISSSMVLQRDAPFKLWGMDVAGSTVSVGINGVTFTGASDSTGRFEIAVPAQGVNTAGQTLTFTSSAGGPATSITDVVFGDVIVCSGQSNMELAVGATALYGEALNQTNGLAATLRIAQVAMLTSYINTTTPQSNLTMSIPWTRATANAAGGMSAVCFFTGAHAAATHPGVPIGLLHTSWGGVAIQVWMSPASLQKCGASTSEPLPHPSKAMQRGYRPGATREERTHAAIAAASLLSARQGVLHDSNSLSAYPSMPSCLYNSMLAPLQALPVSAFLWYQGEANAADPLGYECLLPSMIADWRASWAAAGSDPTAPFAFVQLSAWPAGDTGMIASMRVAMEAALAQPRTGMIVAADMADPAGSFHPIHPPWKYEIGRRAALWLDNALYGNSSSPASGPRVTAVTVDPWEGSWGNYHYGVAGGVCGAGSGFGCAGIRITFDQPITLRGFYQPAAPAVTLQGGDVYGWQTGADSSFELFSDNTATAWSQPASLTGLRDDFTVQLNVTWIGPNVNATVLRYAWHDFPHAMPIVSQVFGLPASPFNATVAISF